MIALTQALSAALLHFLWEGAVVALLLWATLLWLQSHAPNMRYMASSAALCLIAVLPVVTACWLYRVPYSFSGPVGFVTPHSQSWILPGWLTGVALFAFRFLLSYRHVRMLRRTGIPATPALVDLVTALAKRMKVGRFVCVLVSKLADSPSVIGWLRPAILLPAAALTGLEARQLEMILAHELAHIRRHDYLVNVLQTMVETVLFYHPAVWWVSSRMRHERELCCDDMAVRYCGDAVGYARALTVLERLRIMPEPALAANGGSLLYRIQRLTGMIPESSPSRVPVVLAVLAVAVCVLLTVHRAQGQPQKNNASTVVVEATPNGEDVENFLDLRKELAKINQHMLVISSEIEKVKALQKQLTEAQQVSTNKALQNQIRTLQEKLKEVEQEQKALSQSEELVMLQKKLAVMSQIYTFDHPEMRALKERLDQLRSALRKQ